jgi:hypothetical protein
VAQRGCSTAGCGTAGGTAGGHRGGGTLRGWGRRGGGQLPGGGASAEVGKRGDGATPGGWASAGVGQARRRGRPRDPTCRWATLPHRGLGLVGGRSSCRSAAASRGSPDRPRTHDRRSPAGSGHAGLSSARAGLSSVLSVGWGGGESPVGAAGQLPAALVDGPMVAAAEEGQVGQVGGAAVQPGDQVVGLAPGKGPLAVGNHTAAVTHGQRAALGRGHDPAGPADLQGLAGGPTQDGGSRAAAARSRAARSPPAGSGSGWWSWWSLGWWWGPVGWGAWGPLGSRCGRPVGS